MSELSDFLICLAALVLPPAVLGLLIHLRARSKA